MDSLPLFHSWPLFDAPARMAIDHLIAHQARQPAIGGAPGFAAEPPLARAAGLWTCDLATNQLSWTREVHDLFGIPQGEPLDRGLTVSCYAPRARRAMETLRAHAIAHRRGFTLDAMIRRPDGSHRWMRLCAMPLLHEGKTKYLTGTKRDVTADYDGPGWRGF